MEVAADDEAFYRFGIRAGLKTHASEAVFPEPDRTYTSLWPFTLRS